MTTEQIIGLIVALFIMGLGALGSILPGLRARPWCLRQQSFISSVSLMLEFGQLGQHHFGQMRLEVAQAKAERIVGEELRRLGWRQADLGGRPKRDPRKLQIAVRLRQETTLSVKQIAARLHLGIRLASN